MEDVTDAHTKRICKDSKIRNLGDCHDLCVQSNTLLLTDVFENFQNMFLEICDLDPTYFFSAPGLAFASSLKKDYSKIRSFNW